jgi:hypothetical protein
MRFTCIAFLIAFSLQMASVSAGGLQDLMNLADAAASKTSLEELVSKNPKNADARFQLALQYLKANMISQAEEQLRTCMELAPVGSELHTNCIQALRQISESKISSDKKGSASNELKVPVGNQASGTTSHSSGTQTYGTLKRYTDTSNKQTTLKQVKPPAVVPAKK